MASFFIETYGCQMNVSESYALENLFVLEGFEKASSQDKADVVVINTCSVRKSAEDRVCGRLGYYSFLKKNRKFLLIFTGCMAQRLEKTILSDFPFIDYVVPINDKLSIVQLAKSGSYEKATCYSFVSSYYTENSFSSYVPIMNGCNNFCSYCIVPYVRGREVSRSFDSILEEVSYLDSRNVREITLLGQNVNSYDFSGILFPRLLKEVSHLCRNIKFVRFESPHPKDFSDSLIDTVASENVVAKHLHIPMQSGSTQILKAMNRHYSREDFLALLKRIKEAVPSVTFATDVMTGFPGETEKDFEDTLSAMEIMGCTEAFMYFWNPREGTKAFDMPNQVPLKEKKRRLSVLIERQLALAAKIKQERTGTVSDVMIFQRSRDNKAMMLGRNEHNETVVFESVLKAGSMAKVRFDSLNGNTFVGKQL